MQKRDSLTSPSAANPAVTHVKNANRPERVMYEATCAKCGGVAKVPFQPREDRDVYCSECFAKMKAEEEA